MIWKGGPNLYTGAVLSGFRYRFCRQYYRRALGNPGPYSSSTTDIAIYRDNVVLHVVVDFLHAAQAEVVLVRRGRGWSCALSRRRQKKAATQPLLKVAASWNSATAGSSARPRTQPLLKVLRRAAHTAPLARSEPPHSRQNPACTEFTKLP